MVDASKLLADVRLGKLDAGTQAIFQAVSVWEGERLFCDVEVYNHDELSAFAKARLIAAAPDLAAENIALRKHADALANVLDRIVAHYSDDVVNAPGHGHCRPGVWDDDNAPELAGKPCEWCADWAKARAAIAAARSAAL